MLLKSASITKPAPIARLGSASDVTSSSEELCKDPEKGDRIDSPIVRSSFSIIKGSTASISDSLETLPESMPAKNGFRGQRWLRHRVFILYRRFFSLVLLANIAIACFILYRRVKDNRYILADVSTAFAANLCMAVLMRSEPVINLLFTVACSVPTSWPLAIRRHCARIFHIGKQYESSSSRFDSAAYIFIRWYP